MLAGDAFVTSGLVALGYFPCSPHEATVVITTRALEIFRIMRLRCPRLGIQPYVKGLCDMHGVRALLVLSNVRLMQAQAPFRPYLSTQFSVAFDLYLAALALVDERVKKLLGRNTREWRLKNACPPCLYKLEGEPPLLLPLLCTMDGNNSLKRFNRRERMMGENGADVPGESKERTDTRRAAGTYYLEDEEVNLWGDDRLDELMGQFPDEPVRPPRIEENADADISRSRSGARRRRWMAAPTAGKT
jgi:hypothetical protein